MAIWPFRSWMKTKHPPRNDVPPFTEGVISPEGAVVAPAEAVTPPQGGVISSRNGAVPTHKGQLGLVLLNPDNPNMDVTPPAGQHPPESTYLLDIVAIHGITGDAFQTWTHENGTNWLRDFLPNTFPGARIFSFGYPAEIFWSRSDGDIDSFARSLLEGMDYERRQPKHQSRDVMFICHSMGGIIVKKALTIARIDDDDYGAIRKSVSAIFFLSTPHRGAGFASLLKLPLQAVSFPSLPIITLTGKTRKDLLEFLEKDAEPLREISREFRNSIKGIKIASYYERSFMSYLNEVIVNESTGTLGIPGERIIPMHGCDHSTVCKFESDSSAGYKSILAILQKWAEEAKKNVTDVLPEDISCLKTLAFLEMNTRRADADNAHPTTCEWILQHDSFTEWLSNQHGLLWIKGKPGSGKSTLLAFVYRTLQGSIDRSELRLEFFFHGRGEKLQKTSIGMFRSLVYQMFTKDSSIRQPLRHLFHEKAMGGDFGVGWRWQSPELRQLLSDAILVAAKSRKVTIFIDALDEAGADAPSIIKFFHRLNDQINERHSTAKICISCRHYPITAKIPGLDVVVEDHNNDDIAKYVRATLQSEVRRKHGDLDPETWRELEQHIIEKSAGIFQWAHLVIPIVLDHYHDGDSRAAIFRTLATVPEKLEDVYEYILSKIIKPYNRQGTLHLMQWIFLAERPLTATEIRYAIASGSKHGSPLPKACADVNEFVGSDDLMILVITSWSGGLAEVKNHEGKKIVQFIHQSVNDFFLSGGLIFLESVLTDTVGTHNTKRVAKSFDDDIVGRSHDRLARSCITYLKLEEARLSQRENSNLDHLPFLDYATKSWFSHAEKAERLGITQAALIEYFASPPEIVSKWIKAYNIIDEFSRYCPQEGAKLLHVASGANLKTIVSILLQQDADIEEVDNWGNRPLHYAVRRGHKEVAEMLLDKGSILNARNHEDASPLMLAAEFGDLEVVQLLLERGANINEYALQAAARKGNFALVNFLLQAGADVNSKSEAHGIAIHYAARGGHEAILKVLLSHGADIKASTHEYCSTLQAAASIGLGSTPIVQLLLQKGADVHAQGGELGNALQAAALMGNIATVRLLLDAEADINAEGGTNGNALQAAAWAGHLDVIKLLVERGAEVNTQGGSYGSALQAAAYLARCDVVEFLLEKGADVNMKGGNYGSAIQAAATHGNFDIVKLLIQNKAEANARGGEWDNPLRAALCKGHIHVAWLLLLHEARDDIVDEEFNISLKDAAAKGIQELRTFLAPMVKESEKSVSSNLIAYSG